MLRADNRIGDADSMCGIHLALRQISSVMMTTHCLNDGKRQSPKVEEVCAKVAVMSTDHFHLEIPDRKITTNCSFLQCRKTVREIRSYCQQTHIVQQTCNEGLVGLVTN